MLGSTDMAQAHPSGGFRFGDTPFLDLRRTGKGE